MKTTFKPTLVLEMDLMKSLLEDFEKLKQLTEEIDFAHEFWLNQQNRSLFDLLKIELLKLKNSKEINEAVFYDKVFEKCSNSIKDFDLKLYEDFYEIDFKYYKTLMDYYQYFKCKHIYSLLQNLPKTFEDFYTNPDVIFESLDLVKKEYKTLLIRKI